MSYVRLSWDATTWLINNYKTNNGLPSFFAYGDYSYQTKALGESEYKAAVLCAAESNNDDYSGWAQAIIDNDFSVLENMSVTDYWDNLLTYQNQQRTITCLKQVKFKNTDSFSSVYTSQKPTKAIKKRKAPTNTSSSRESYTEIDGIFIPGLNSSLGKYIGTLGRNSDIVDRKSRYFVSLGLNGILDLTDQTPGSQLASLPTESIQACFTKFRTTRNTTANPILDQYEELMAVQERKYDKYVQKCLHNVKQSVFSEKYDIIHDIYEHILKLHHYTPELFKEDYQSFLSEQDFVVKFWGPLVEIMFRGTRILPHWGDTVSEQSVSAGARYKMDLRLLSFVADIKKNIDASNAEFSKEQNDNKYYKDLLKAVSSSKVQLNSFISSHVNLTNQEITDIELPFSIISGMTCEIYAISLKAPGLYVFQDITHMKIPMTFQELKKGGILKIFNSLSILKDMCLKIKDLNAEREQLLSPKKIKVISKNSNKEYATPGPAKSKWTRSLWIPPPMDDSDDSDIEN